jgi:hypothetical protein
MPIVTLSSTEHILGRNARFARDYPGAQHVPLDYPGHRPATSFLYLGGRIAPVRESPSRPGLLINECAGEKSVDEFLAAHDLVPLCQRYAVLAVGSNACPGRLEEKFIDKDHDAIIVIKGWIADVDSIYSACLTDYGGLPATITEAPGTEIAIWLTLLTHAQLTIMNASEGLGDDYSLVSVASPVRVGLAKIENIYAYFDRRALVLEGEKVRIGAFPAQNSNLRSLTEKQVLTAVLDKLEFGCGQSIEQRHHTILGNPAVIGNLNARLAKSFTEIIAHSRTIGPAPKGELQLMQWSHGPITGGIGCIPFRAHRTIKRHDYKGEFIVRLNAGARRLLPRRCKFVSVHLMVGRLPTDDGSLVVPKVIAAVRPLLKEDGALIGCDEIGFCQLDMVLRVSIGAQGYDPTNWWTLSDVTGDAEYIGVEPLTRSIRPSAVGSLLGYQWMLFRVHRALDGDFETPICRVRQQYLSTLGIHDGGIVVVESVANRAIRRLLPADEKQTESLLDFDGQLEGDNTLSFEEKLGADKGLRIPCIYLDYATRDQLHIVPGQVVWVRRELPSVFRREFLKIASALALAVLGIAFSARELVEKLLPRHSSWGDWLLGILVGASVLMILSCAYHECRNAVRSE